MDTALLDLLQTKELSFITVKEICAAAGVNRLTFYLHYENIGDLLTEAVEQINNDFFEIFKSRSKISAERISSCPLEELVLVTPDYLDPYLDFIRENHRAFSCIAFIRPTGIDPEKTYRHLYGRIFSPILERFRIPEEEREYIMLFYLNGIMAILHEWVAKGCALSNDKVSAIIVKCVRPTFGET